MVPKIDFWRGRRVFITGHTGFKGAWLSFWLLELEAKVFGYSNGIPTARSLFEDLGLSKLLEDRRGDIRNAQCVKEAVEATRPDIVLHLAAQPLVRRSYASPLETYATNVMGTVHVLEAARAASGGVPALVVTTDKCYENREWIWGYRETEPMGGYDPYSSSKACAELVTSAYARSYSSSESAFRIASARAGNVIGGGDWAPDRLVPDLVRGLLTGESVGIRNPRAVRPWQHVLEPLCGYLLLAQGLLDGADVAGQGWNFGPDVGSEVSVREVADKLCHLWARSSGWHPVGNQNDLHEANMLRLDSSKARRFLGWRPQWSLGEALTSSVEVYRSTERGEDLQHLLRAQIGRYLHASGLSQRPEQ
jgi:CDP-glucose 4,6-dehydratase